MRVREPSLLLPRFLLLSVFGSQTPSPATPTTRPRASPRSSPQTLPERAYPQRARPRCNARAPRFEVHLCLRRLLLLPGRTLLAHGARWSPRALPMLGPFPAREERPHPPLSVPARGSL